MSCGCGRLYLGLHQARVQKTEYYEILDEVCPKHKHACLRSRKHEQIPFAFGTLAGQTRLTVGCMCERSSPPQSRKGGPRRGACRLVDVFERASKSTFLCEAHIGPSSVCVFQCTSKAPVICDVYRQAKEAEAVARLCFPGMRRRCCSLRTSTWSTRSRCWSATATTTSSSTTTSRRAKGPAPPGSKP